MRLSNRNKAPYYNFLLTLINVIIVLGIFAFILEKTRLAMFGGFTIPAFAQEQKRDSLPDMVQLGYQTEMPQKAIAGSTRSVNSKVLDKAPEIDIAKALYGKIAGLNVYQGNGSRPA